MGNTSDDKYNELRQILERQNGRVYTLEEAKEIGNGLMDFFATLNKLADEYELVTKTKEAPKSFQD